MSLNLDFSFFTWEVVSSFIIKGFFFSVQLTLIAMVGGAAVALAVMSFHRILFGVPVVPFGA